MTWLYILLSLFILIPTYLIIQKLTSSGEVYHKFFGILTSCVFMSFHFYTYHLEKIPFLDISIAGNDAMHYSAITLGFISGFVGWAAHHEI
ncbi:hypothetical protein [Pectobacterium polaris]|uniref:hypothetical protein n=1 Tax=Pectobacterium polaris TaxID=2042057 RepID=UPI001969A0B2|nr:hypothetical protein [Pectobacterium polaris]MBN3217502.1 hypothetical protein [Pectobacterium polaris]